MTLTITGVAQILRAGSLGFGAGVCGACRQHILAPLHAGNEVLVVLGEVVFVRDLRLCTTTTKRPLKPNRPTSLPDAHATNVPSALDGRGASASPELSRGFSHPASCLPRNVPPSWLLISVINKQTHTRFHPFIRINKKTNCYRKDTYTHSSHILPFRNSKGEPLCSGSDMVGTVTTSDPRATCSRLS